MRFVLPAPDPHDGLPFAMSDLQMAMEWASAHPSARLRVATNYRRSPEIIQIYYRDAVLPRWVLWRDQLRSSRTARQGVRCQNPSNRRRHVSPHWQDNSERLGSLRARLSLLTLLSQEISR